MVWKVAGSGLTDCFVASEVVDVPLWVIWVRGVAVEGEVKQRVVVVCTEGLAIHEVVRMPSLVDSLSDLDGYSRVRRIELDWVVRFH